MKDLRKEIYREFELEKLIFLDTGPGGGGNPESQAKVKEATEASEAAEQQEVVKASKTPEQSREKATKTTEATKKSGGSAVDNNKKQFENLVILLGGNKDLRINLTRQFELKGDFSKIASDPGAKKALNGFIKKLSSKERKQLSEGTLKLTPETRKKLSDSLGKAIGLSGEKMPTVKEIQVIGKFKIGESTFLEIYGKAAATLASMRHDFRENPEKEGELQVKVMKGEKESWLRMTEGKIHTYIGKKISDDHILETKNTNGKVVGRRIKDKDEFEKAVNGKIKTLSAAIEMRDTLTGDVDKNKGKMGLMEMIASGVQLMGMFKKAMETGDFQSLTDAMESFKNGENINVSIKNAKDTYDAEIAKVDLKDMLKMHAKPYGEEAQTMFGTGKNATPFRIQLKSSIEARMAKSLGAGTTIRGMETQDGGEATRILATKGRTNYEINITVSGGQHKVEFLELGMKDGKETITNQSGSIDLDGLGQGTGLEGRFAEFAATKPSTPKPAPTPSVTPEKTTPPKPKEKEKPKK